jgi:hypothetical protein
MLSDVMQSATKYAANSIISIITILSTTPRFIDSSVYYNYPTNSFEMTPVLPTTVGLHLAETSERCAGHQRSECDKLQTESANRPSIKPSLDRDQNLSSPVLCGSDLTTVRSD